MRTGPRGMRGLATTAVYQHPSIWFSSPKIVRSRRIRSCYSLSDSGSSCMSYLTALQLYVLMQTDFDHYTDAELSLLRTALVDKPQALVSDLYDPIVSLLSTRRGPTRVSQHTGPGGDGCYHQSGCRSWSTISPLGGLPVFRRLPLRPTWGSSVNLLSGHGVTLSCGHKCTRH